MDDFYDSDFAFISYSLFFYKVKSRDPSLPNWAVSLHPWLDFSEPLRIQVDCFPLKALPNTMWMAGINSKLPNSSFNY